MFDAKNGKGILMRSPLWVLDSTLVLLLFIALSIMALFKTKLPARKSLTPQNIAPLQQDVSKVNITRIYESDLFATRIQASPQKREEKEKTITIPQPPQIKEVSKRTPATPEFLAPLEISLKGVIFNSQSIHSRAIISDKKTKQEELYKIGDNIADANLIYIGKNKAIFIRSNGQQETVFISEEDAKNDPIYNVQQEWSSAVEKIDESNYIINLKPFSEQISNLPQLLNTLDITTAFEKGKSIGCRVGRMNPQSLGPSLGFNYEDIISKINTIPTTSTSDRVRIFKEIENIQNNDTINIEIIRKGRIKNLTYIIRTKPEKKRVENIRSIPAGTAFSHKDGKVVLQPHNDMKIAEQTLAQSRSNNALSNMFRHNDKKAMLNYGGRNALLKR